MIKQERERSGGLHFTIGSAAGDDSSGNLDLRQDLALVKATLLYADRGKLCSTGSSVLSAIAEFQESSSEAKARLVVSFLADLQPSMTPQEIYFFEAVVGLRSREEKRSIPKKTRKQILAMVAEKQGPEGGNFARTGHGQAVLAKAHLGGRCGSQPCLAIREMASCSRHASNSIPLTQFSCPSVLPPDVEE